MAKQDFKSVIQNNILKNTNVASEMNRLNSKDDLNKIYSVVRYDDIEPNELNDYEIIDLEELRDEISLYGLIQPLNLFQNPPDSDKKYRLYGGERRYRAIGMLLDSGDTMFQAGIPAIIDIPQQEISLVDEEILLILANKARTMTEEFKAKKAARLVELYKQKNLQNGENISATKQAAKALGIGERQVQRYNATKKLIPELMDAFNASKFNLERASQFASMDEESQHLLSELLKENSDITKKEFEQYKETKEEKEEMLSLQLEQLSLTIEEQKIETSSLESLLKEKAETETKLREEIRKELESENPSTDIINTLNTKIEKFKKEKELIGKEKESSMEKLKTIEQQNFQLEKEINLLKEIPSHVLNREELERIQKESDLSHIRSIITENVLKYQNSTAIYNEKYYTLPEIDEKFLEKVKQF